MAEFTKISIPGPTLSYLLHHSSTTSGLLFGQVTTLPSAGPTDDDADPTPSSSSTSALSLTITSFVSIPFFNSLGLRTNPTNPRNPNPNTVLLGWFSSRPSSPLRPSIRDLAVSHHLSHTLTLTPTPNSKSCAFFLLSSFTTPNLAVHTHEYRAFMYVGSKLRPISVDVINVGPKFRGQYGGFIPESSVMFPMIRVPHSSTRVLDEGEMEVESGVDGEWEVEGFGMERLEGMMGAEYTRELEDLYGKMMGKLDGLVRMVEVSSANIQEQESQNSVLRNKIAGLE